MFPVTQYQKNITYYYVMEYDIVSLQNPSGTDAQCNQQVVEM